MIESEGTIAVSKNRIVVNLGADTINYYLWFIKREYWICPQGPRWGGHISICLPSMNSFNYNLAKSFNGKKVKFKINPYIIIGGYKKGFINFWSKVESPEIERIIEILRIKEKSDYLHLTFGQCGKKGSLIKMWWPQMIEVNQNQYKNELDGPGTKSFI